MKQRPNRNRQILTMVALSMAVGACGGGGSSAPTPAPAFMAPSSLNVTIVPEVGSGNSATFTFVPAPNTQSLSLEIGRSSGASDVAVISLGAAATTHTQGGLPYGVLYARMVGTSTTGQKSAPSNEVLIGSYDPRQIIDAVFFGSGPLAVAGNAGCPRGGQIMDGFSSGTTMRIEGTTTLTAEQMSGLRDTAAQIGTLTQGDQAATFAFIADPGSAVSNPGQDRMFVRSATQAEVSAQCNCTSCVGCASSYFRGSLKSGVYMQALSTAGAPTVSHEIGHGIGFCHIISAVGINPPMTLGVTTDGIFSPTGRLGRIDPVMAKAMETVYKAGLRPGDNRARFVAAGLVSANATLGEGPDAALRGTADAWRLFRGRSRAQQNALAELFFGKGATIDFDERTDEVRVTRPICTEPHDERR